MSLIIWPSSVLIINDNVYMIIVYGDIITAA